MDSPFRYIGPTFKQYHDRFNYWNRYSSINWADSDCENFYPEYLNLTDLFDARAKDLISRYDRIAVLWSGGVDSTLALAALIRMGATNLTVIGTKQSIAEFQSAFAYLLKAGINTIIDCNVKAVCWCEKFDVIVDGHGADSFGYFQTHPYTWDASLEDYYYEKTRGKGSAGEKARDILIGEMPEYFKKHFGVVPETAAQVWWMECRCFCMDHERNLTNAFLYDTPNRGKGVSFFDFPHYDNAIFGNIWGKLPDLPNMLEESIAYKAEFKQYIITVFKDQDYLLKGKGNSWSSYNPYMAACPGFRVFTDCGVIDFSDPSLLPSEITEQEIDRNIAHLKINYPIRTDRYKQLLDEIYQIFGK